MAQAAEVQGLLEDLAALGYAAKAPVGLGQAPHFEWVADCLLWLCQRAAPELSVPRDYGSEQKRVAFLNALGSQLYAQTRIRLRLPRLYRAGGSAVRELRRLAASLRQAGEAAPSSSGSLPADGHAAAGLTDVRLREGGQAARELGQRIGASGAALVAALAAAPDAAAAVASTLLATADLPALQRQLQAALGAAHQQAAQLEKAVAALGQEQAALEGRIERRHQELDRAERRLDSLQAVKPAHSAEAEALERELGGLYSLYLHKFRNLEYLEGQLDKYSSARQAEADEADRQLRRIQRQCAADELRLLAGADQNGSPNTAAALEAAAGLDSDDDSEGQLGGGWGPKALPRLGGHGGGAAAMAAGSGAALGAGKLVAAAAALDLQLLPAEDSGGSGGAAGGPGPAAASGRSRLSLSSAAGMDAGGMPPGEGKVTFGGASLIPAHRAPGGSGSGSGASQRPGSARRTTGSGSALLKRAGGGGGGGGAGVEEGAADVLLLDGARQRASWHDADNDF